MRTSFVFLNESGGEYSPALGSYSAPARPSLPVIVEGLKMEPACDGLRRCYVCGERLPIASFWRGRRLCIACQSAMHSKPETLFGVKVLVNPPPHRAGKCILGACTHAGVLEGLCVEHGPRFRAEEVVVVLTAGLTSATWAERVAAVTMAWWGKVMANGRTA